AAAMVLLAVRAGAADLPFEQALADVQQRWAEANYQATGKSQKKAFDTLLDDARALAAAHPKRAEALIWRGIVASSYAGVKGPFGAMSLAREAKASLEAAKALDAEALDGSALTSLGVLYYKVPGGIIGFGDRDLARHYLKMALALNPDGIDANYFYGELMFEEEQYAEAKQALLHALQAPPRPERPLADSGRRHEIAQLLERVNARLERSS
ncbi:MAG TPA: tetratricopeptide repeat protein, partial [Woeseiaceae bacterium]|nr:tetratricopeptide repeat protein [Woeseiaceae bacterium]